MYLKKLSKQNDIDESYQKRRHSENVLLVAQKTSINMKDLVLILGNIV